VDRIEAAQGVPFGQTTGRRGDALGQLDHHEGGEIAIGVFDSSAQRAAGNALVPARAGQSGARLGVGRA
jgi:hypothetical protein